MRIRGLRAKAGLGLVAMAGAMPVVAGGGVASANPALCGMVVNSNTVLTSDVGPCSDTGIIIGASNVVLDLNGHRVFGLQEEAFEGAGILAVNRTGVTIRNGTVQHFDAGVVIQGGSGNTIANMVVRDNIGHAATDFGDGILLFASSRNRVMGNTADHNGPYDGIGTFGNSDDNLIEGNTSINNNIVNARSHGGTEGTQEDDGIRIEGGGDRNTVRGNYIGANGLDGIAVFPNANDNRIFGNTIENNGFLGNVRRGDGIHLFGRVFRTVVQGNRVLNNARHGIRIDATVQIQPPQLNNRILGNTSLGNGVDPGEDFGYDVSDNNRFCDANQWQGNIVNTEDPVPGIDCYL